MDEAQVSRHRIDTRTRVLMAVWSCIVVSYWLYVVLNIVKYNYSLYKLSDAVVITLLTTTTINVLGLTAIILKGLFYDGKLSRSAE